MPMAAILCDWRLEFVVAVVLERGAVALVARGVVYLSS
jgi:hypothetical protein